MTKNGFPNFLRNPLLCTLPCPTVGPLVCPLVWHTLILFCFCGLWPYCSCPNDQVTSNTAPAYPHTTVVAMYSALFWMWMSDLFTKFMFACESLKISSIYIIIHITTFDQCSLIFSRQAQFILVSYLPFRTKLLTACNYSLLRLWFSGEFDSAGEFVGHSCETQLCSR